MKQFFKTCHVFRHPESIFVFGVINTPYGGITVPPAAKLPLTANASDLSGEITRILNGLPSQFAEVNLATARQPFLEYLKDNGFRNATAFERKASLVTVHYDGELYEVVPYETADKGGFVAMASARSVRTSSPEELGKGVITALELVRS